MATIYLAIDPGSRHTGIAGLRDKKQFTSQLSIDKADDDHAYYIYYHDLVVALNEVEVDLRKTNDDYKIVVESFKAMGFKASMTQHFKMGRVMQVISHTIFARYCIWPEYIPAYDVNEWLCGDRKAKPSVVNQALKAMGYTVVGEHARSAMALALFYRHELDTYGEIRERRMK
jgi:Holliday junction resolvasome RuvABC endonuclease subunit